MASENHGAVLRGIERIFSEGSLTGLTESQLLGRFAGGDEAAFEALVTRHGPMVLGVGRRLLRDPRDVEDAFQATFLVLLRKAGGIRDAEALGPWLYGVAYRVASRIRSRVAQRPDGERKGARPEAVATACELERGELQAVIDEEINRLPEKYRRPVVLCDLEGRTYEEAARRLRCTTGSVSGRLIRARRTLRARLARRGLAPAAGLGALALGSETAAAAVPTPMIAGTVATLSRAATATAVSAATSTAALELANGVFHSMVVAKLKLAASFLAAASIILAVGTAWLVAHWGSAALGGRDVAVMVASGAPGAAPAAQNAQDEGVGRSIELRVVDQRTGKPLAHVAIGVEVEGNLRERKTTDDAGRAAVAVPAPTPQRLSVKARKDGYATITAWLSDPEIRDNLPSSYTLRMYPAETLGGVVRDENDRPVEGVQVTPTIGTIADEFHLRPEMFDDPAPATTDAQGRWRCSGLPAGIDHERISIRFTHPDYQEVSLPNGQAIDGLRQGKATVLPRGLELAGRVVDPAGQPIRGARVLRGSDRFLPDFARAETDADGRWRFPHLPAGETVLTVHVPVYAPALQKVVVRPGLPPLELRLAKGRPVRGRVVNARGEPLSGATVNFDGWRGHRTLEWQIFTNNDGEFQWTDAPPDSFWVDVWRTDYLRIDRREVPPAGGELTITMTRQLKVRGTVVDAATRHAVQSFTLVPGRDNGNGFATYWDRRHDRPFRGGRYEIAFEDEAGPSGRRLRIEADGYMPAVCRVIHDGEDDPVVNFVLHKSTGVSGVAHAPDDAPMAGADVVMVLPSQPAFLTNGRPPTINDHRVVKTGHDGRFTFPPQEPPYSIVVLHDRGFAEQAVRDAEAPPVTDLTVRPWGRIEGTLRIGNRPGAGQTLNLTYHEHGDTPSARPWWSGSATTDDTGRFVFERVMPGEVTVARRVLIKDMSHSQTWGHSHGMPVVVRPGETARPNMGGVGRPVVGKVTVPAGFTDPIDWTFSNNTLSPKETVAEKLLARAGVKQASPRAPWGCTVKLEADGSFRVEDVEAGTHDLFITVNDPPRDPFKVGLGLDVIATARREVVVLPMPGGRSDEPLDIGTIPVTILKKPEPPPASPKP
jgi:RNA polymerase sigma factor (sigma-70 family)